MTTQPEALRLADELEMWTKGEPAAAELRRLHESNQELLATLKLMASHAKWLSVTTDAFINKAEGEQK
jgi:hypothetical protein